MSVLVELVDPGALPEDGPGVVVLDLRGGIPLERQYLEAADHPPRAGGTPAAVVRTPHLSTRDELEVGEVGRDGDALTFTVRIREFTGGLFANVVQVALVAVVLPALETGRHLLRVEERVEPFPDDDDATGGEPSVRTHEVSFAVRGEDGS